jgi:hypothetical protein
MILEPKHSQTDRNFFLKGKRGRNEKPPNFAIASDQHKAHPVETTNDAVHRIKDNNERWARKLSFDMPN